MVHTRYTGTLLNPIGKVFAYGIAIAAIVVSLEVNGHHANLWGIIIGLAIFLGATFFASMYEGMKIDTKRRMIMYFYSVYGLRKGKWKPLPPISQITVSIHTTSKIVEGGRSGNTIYVKDGDYYVKMFLEDTTNFYVVDITKDKEAAMSYGKTLSKQLDIPFLDLTNGKEIKQSVTRPGIGY